MNKKLLILSFPCLAMLALPNDSFGAVRIGNQTRSQQAAAYNQVMMLQQQAQNQNQNTQTETTAEALPVRVASTELAAAIARGDTTAGVDVNQLESCARIYPGGDFAWDKPTAGRGVGASSTCVAVVEMRFVNGTSDIVVARANVAAGDAINCNIEEFPEATYTADAYNVTFPADKEPTVQDVVKKMNEEQKKNAGFKIAASAVVGGLIGNVAGKQEIGESGLMGTGKGKMQSTMVGALSGAAVGAGNSYAGKVGGDMILSAGVNAAAGGAIGNMMASGNSVLRVEKCDIDGADKKCLWGIIQRLKPFETDEYGNPTEVAFYNIETAKIMICTPDKNTDDKYINCREQSAIGLVFGDYQYASIEEGAKENFAKVRNNPNKQFKFNSETDGDGQERTMTQGQGLWIRATEGGRPVERVSAMIVGFPDKAFGSKMSDWYEWRDSHSGAEMVGRDNQGKKFDLPVTKEGGTEFTLAEFYPLTVSAEDGGIIDISNPARMKSTMIGAGAGAGLGAFTAYQGAQDDIDVRWVSAVTEYKDSLQKVYCATGTRFLSSYNDMVIIPNMQ